MSPEVMLMLAISAIMSVPLYILGIFLLRGKGVSLIAGYNTMPKAEREKYDEKALARAVGKLLIVLAMLSLLFPAAIALDRMWLTWAAIGLFIAVAAAGVIYMNTGNRFRK